MYKCNKLLHMIVLIAVICAGGGLVLPQIRDGYERYRQESSGTPDAVRSVSSGGECRLTVVANRDEVEDPEDFAEEVIRMYQENTFETIRFSRDLEPQPECLLVSVYLRRKDLETGTPVMSFRYDPRQTGDDRLLITVF